uniref:Uncharacterized protein n=1 Tax=Setaria italica TaxID=4555 RepID=K4AN61_SETIT
MYYVTKTAVMISQIIARFAKLSNYVKEIIVVIR